MICSSAHFGPADPWHERASLVRTKGTAPLLETSSGRWFATADVADTPFGRGLLGNLADADPVGYAACCDALAGYDLRPELTAISAPALVVGGTFDTATPLEHARELADGIPHAALNIIACGHLAAERPDDLQDALTTHLNELRTYGRRAMPCLALWVRGNVHGSRGIARPHCYRAERPLSQVVPSRGSVGSSAGSDARRRRALVGHPAIADEVWGWRPWARPELLAGVFAYGTCLVISSTHKSLGKDPPTRLPLIRLESPTVCMAGPPLLSWSKKPSCGLCLHRPCPQRGHRLPRPYASRSAALGV